MPNHRGNMDLFTRDQIAKAVSDLGNQIGDLGRSTLHLNDIISDPIDADEAQDLVRDLDKVHLRLNYIHSALDALISR